MKKHFEQSKIGNMRLFFLLILLLFSVSCRKVDVGDLDNPTGVPLDDDIVYCPTPLRVVSYNGYWGSVFPQDDGKPPLPGKHDAKDRTSNFIRMHNALRPDVWVMQEILYSSVNRKVKTPEGILRNFNKDTGEDWYVAADVRGRLVLSRYPIKWSKKLGPRTFGVLIDLPDNSSAEDLLIVDVHFHWNNPDKRAEDAIQVVDFLNQVKNGEILDIASNSMLMVCGDFNDVFNSLPHKIISSLNPAIKMNDVFEPKLKDKRPVQLKGTTRITYGSTTFQGNSTSVSGGTIDHMLVSDGPLKMTNTFILNTLILDNSELDDLGGGLKRNDVAMDPDQVLNGRVPFDHLPVVADFSIFPH